MSENKALPPDLDRQIIAEAAFGASVPGLIMAVSPFGAPSDHLVILRRIEALLADGRLESYSYTDLQRQQRDCVISTFTRSAGGVAA